MSTEALRLASPHEHVYLGDNHERNERRTWLVIAITAAMMVAEITAGSIYGSMALIADGWHMSTHAGAMLIAALAMPALPSARARWGIWRGLRVRWSWP